MNLLRLDRQALTNVLGDFGSNTEITITKETARQLEVELGLQEDSIRNGFKIRQVDDIKNQKPRSPVEGTNENFTSAGEHLPGGGPEIVIDLIPTKDSDNSRVILRINVE